MKPVYLEMNYFGPHEHSIIDFRRLEEAPIFLIGGDTGAGKSTIFDAMTFALFGSTTSDRNAKEMRSQFAPDDKITSVTFYFEQGNNLYKIVRTPEQELAKKNKGTGTTKKKTTATLSIVDKVGGVEIQSIASKPMDVGNEIADILNLSADQFKKIILLPQNDFSEFLKSPTNNKETILKKIFGTQIFSDFTNKLKENYDAVKQQSSDFETELKTQINSMNLSDEELESLGQVADDQQVALLKEFVDKRKTAMAQSQTASDKSKKAMDTADEKLQKANSIAQQFEQLAELKKSYQENIVDRTSEINHYKQHISELDWANGFKDTIRDLDRTKREHAQSSHDEQTLQEQLETVQIQFDSVQKKLTDLTDRSDEFDAKHKRLDVLANLIPAVIRYEELIKNLETIRPQIAELNKKIDEQTAISASLTDEIKTKQANLLSIENLQKQKDAVSHEKETLVDILSPVKNQQDSLKTEITEFERKIVKLNDEYQQKQAHLDATKKDYQQKIGTRQSLMIAQLRQELVAGEPCAVCGSTEHPTATLTVKADETELKKSMEEVDESQKAYAASENSLKIARDNLDEFNKTLADKKTELAEVTKQLNDKYQKLVDTSELNFPDKFEMNDVKNIFDKKINDIENSLTKARNLAKEIQNLTEQLDHNNQQITKIQLNLTENKSKQATYSADLKQVTADIDTENEKNSSDLNEEKTQLNQEIRDYDKELKESQDKVHQSEISLKTGKTQLADIEKQIKKQAAVMEQLQDNLTTALNSEDAKTNNYDILNNWISELNADKYTNIQKNISQYNKEKEMLDADIKKISVSLTNVKVPDLEILKQNLAEQKTANNIAVTRAAQLKLTFDNTAKIFKRIQKIVTDQSSFSKKLTEITSLYNVITGKDGNDDKLKLETYVVQNYLRKVLDYANSHFINLLSNNRYTFELSSQGSDKRTDHGLDINVYDNETGAMRSSDTLSGGETFIAALSIALSLSEVVQSSTNGVQIDALFIDEGFGSLDHETLSKAMTALETIGENRMVGVISHIETMKATIGQQVLIKKVGDGRSTVEIVTK
ncbi:AAA family ATPase [Companilactobacillus jidongensis]|uniref:AAA family ATPase n=1 Tax=Companilactobacillus jidongensis TaxID=2486006 RepID=UPI000F79B806|nr:SMC family ATPase [Companilactobacillus jidongensis]